MDHEQRLLMKRNRVAGIIGVIGFTLPLLFMVALNVLAGLLTNWTFATQGEVPDIIVALWLVSGIVLFTCFIAFPVNVYKVITGA
jgi:uncharacterized BrkB/YihY/UPF0761 family membrane protein